MKLSKRGAHLAKCNQAEGKQLEGSTYLLAVHETNVN